MAHGYCVVEIQALVGPGLLLEKRVLTNVLPALFNKARRPIPDISTYTSPAFRAVPARSTDAWAASGPYLREKKLLLNSFETF